MKQLIPILFLISTVCLAQRKKERETSSVISQPNRIEIEAEGNGDFYLINGEEKGFLIIQDTKISVSANAHIWRLYCVDTAFQIVWEKDLIIPLTRKLIGMEFSNSNYYLFFRKKHHDRVNFTVLMLVEDSPHHVEFDINTVFPIDIGYFEIVGKNIIIAGNANGRPVVISYSIEEKIPKVLPGFYNSKSKILNLVVDDASQIYSIVMSEKMRYRKKYTIRVKTFTSSGDLLENNSIIPGDKKSLLDGASTSFNNGLQYVAGTQTRKSIYYSQGVYLAKFMFGLQSTIKFYPFADLENFFGYLKPRKEQRIKNKIGRKKEKGKVKRFNYRLLVHDIIEAEDGYIMIAEAYYPRYNYNSTNSLGYVPVPGSNYFNPYFMGYQFTHAVIIGFDQDCNIRWDHTFKIEDIEIFTLRKNVTVSVDNENVLLAYPEENEIRTKILSDNSIIEGKTYNPIKLSFENDELKSKNNSIDGIERLYGNSLIAYGMQHIRNDIAINGKLNRWVFYVNKVQFNLN